MEPAVSIESVIRHMIMCSVTCTVERLHAEIRNRVKAERHTLTDFEVRGSEVMVKIELHGVTGRCVIITEHRAASEETPMPATVVAA